MDIQTIMYLLKGLGYALCAISSFAFASTIQYYIDSKNTHTDSLLISTKEESEPSFDGLPSNDDDLPMFVRVQAPHFPVDKFSN